MTSNSGIPSPYKDFIQRFKLLINKNPQLITTTLSNIFTMRLVGNKTHGDLAEIAISEFINQYMYDYRSVHVGKDLFRAKQSEEDIKIINELNQQEFSISLKAYGDGPLQLSTDKRSLMFAMLREQGSDISNRDDILHIMNDPIFANFSNINVLPLIYDEKRQRCSMLVFNYDRAKNNVARIRFLPTGENRIHPVYRFYDQEDSYICEVRYGGASANALQRGFWTHTRNAIKYFDSLTDGWIDYSNSMILVQLLSHALIATSAGHNAALKEIQADIENQKRTSSLK